MSETPQGPKQRQGAKMRPGIAQKSILRRSPPAYRGYFEENSFNRYLGMGQIEWGDENRLFRGGVFAFRGCFVIPILAPVNTQDSSQMGVSRQNNGPVGTAIQ
jgi:hypothetical protein